MTTSTQVQPPVAASSQEKYPAIADHGLIGDLQTAALVDTRGVIDWFCSPRFDSPSIFASLLDRDRGGHFRIGSAAEAVTKQLYFPSSAVLITRFMAEEGVGEVLDFMPVDHPEAASDRHQIVRIMRTVRGSVQFALECAPRFDYGRQDHALELTDAGAVFKAADTAVTIHTPITLERIGRDVRGEVTLSEGQTSAAVLDAGPLVRPRTIESDALLGMAQATIDYWTSGTAFTSNGE